MNKIFTKSAAVLLFATGSINMVSAQASLKIGSAPDPKDNTKILGPFTIDPSAALEVASTNKGFLPPRVADEKVSFPDKRAASATGVTPVVSAVPYGPEKGLVVYNTTRNELLVNIGTDGASKWFSIVAASPKSNIRTITSAAEDNKNVEPTDNTIICDTSKANFTLNLPTAASSEGRILMIGRIDDSSNTLTFSQSIKIGEQTTTDLTYPKKPFKIQSNGTEWVVVDDNF